MSFRVLLAAIVLHRCRQVPTLLLLIHDMSIDHPKIADRLTKFLEGCDLAGFNVMRFDLPLLKSEFSSAGMGWPEQAVLYWANCGFA
jgi:hypothetical protein